MGEIVFASGSFDILHTGHLNFLERAKELGSKLIVGVEEDKWVEDVKGHKPYMPEAERLRIIQSLSLVDEAFLVYGPRYPNELLGRGVTIRAIGEDRRLVWNESDEIKDRMEGAGIRYVHLPTTPNISSTVFREQLEKSYDYFVVCSSSLISQAAQYVQEMRTKLGQRCFFPAMDVPSPLSPSDYKAVIVDAIRRSKKAAIFWDGVSHGPLVDLGICLGAGVEVTNYEIHTTSKADAYIKELATHG